MNRRIALISEHASPLGVLGGIDSGGQNVYVGQIARLLAERGHDVDVLTRRDREELPEVVNLEPGLRVIHINAGPPHWVAKEALLPYMPEFTVQALRLARERGYDLIHANFWMSGLVAAEIKRQLGIPFVITFHALGQVRRLHQGATDGFPDERLCIEQRLVREADRIIAECPQDEADLRTLYEADPSRLAVIPCGFDPAELFPVDGVAARMRLGLPADEPIVLQLGRMVPRKGVDTAVRALGVLHREHGIAARLVIVGGECEEPDPGATPEIARLQRIAEEEGIAEHVVFAGRRDRAALKLYYSAADVFVSTPWYEPFGITPLEAMACGTPVIGSCVGGIKFSVVDGETGFLVPPKDHGAVADRLARVISSPELRQLLSEQAIRRVNQLFTWQRVTEMLDEVYDDVLMEHREVPRLIATDAQTIRRGIDGAIAALEATRERLPDRLTAAGAVLSRCLKRGGKVLVCGNGGSAADSQHFSAELMGRFKQPDRRALPVLPLTADTAILTAWANDVSFEAVFSRQVEALGQPGDVLVVISTSGRSPNVIRAIEAARERGMTTLALLGGQGGAAAAIADLPLVVPSTDTQHIQEVHLVLIHLLCELVEDQLTGKNAVEARPKDSAPRQLAQASRTDIVHRTGKPLRAQVLT